MRILVSNDDGINARGIKVLAQRLAAEPENEVYVCAPDRERSAMGHALTLHKPLRVEDFDNDWGVKAAWYTTGTPSDCVKFAIGSLLTDPVKIPIDCVVSGINSGANLGCDIFYSGTVSAAREGAFFDIPSIAVSCAGSGQKHYEPAADFVARLLKGLPKSDLQGKTLLNINVPNVPAQEIKGTLVTRLGVRAYNDYYEKRIDPRGRTYYWLAGEAIEEGEEEHTDVWCCSHNMISVTPINFNMTDFGLKEKLESWGHLGDLTQSWATEGAPVASATSNRKAK